jgi:DNA-binding IclR family transcriptional regulator
LGIMSEHGFVEEVLRVLRSLHERQGRVTYEDLCARFPMHGAAMREALARLREQGRVLMAAPEAGGTAYLAPA